MARAKVIHSTDSCEIKFEGNRVNPEPSEAVISFPGGHVAVARCTDGSYWAHVHVEDCKNTVDSRLTYDHRVKTKSVLDLPDYEFITDLSLRIGR